MTADLATSVLLGAVLLAGIVQGASGFAFSAVAGAILLQFEPPGETIRLLMLCGLIVQALVLVRLRKSISWWGSLPYIAGGAAGVLVAMISFNVVGPDGLRAAFGGFLIAYATRILLRWRPAFAEREAGLLGGTAIGFAGGLVGSFTAMPGAVLAICCDAQSMPTTTQHSLVQPFVAAMQTLALTFLLLRSEAGTSLVLLQDLLVALPALLLGAQIGVYLLGKVNVVVFRNVVCVLLLLSGVAMVS